MGRAGGCGGRGRGVTPVPVGWGDELCPWGQHPLPGLIQTRGIGSSACRRQLCHILLFSISHLATFLSEKLAGEPLLALGIRII